MRREITGHGKGVLVFLSFLRQGLNLGLIPVVVSAARVGGKEDGNGDRNHFIRVVSYLVGPYYVVSAAMYYIFGRAEFQVALTRPRSEEHTSELQSQSNLV